MIVNLFLDRHPYSPNKRLLTAKDRNFKTSSEEEPLPIDDALIRTDQSAGVALFSLPFMFAYLSGNSAAKLIGTPT